MKRLLAKGWLWVPLLLGLAMVSACSIESGGEPGNQNDAGPGDLDSVGDQDQPADGDNGPDEDAGGDQASCQDECPASGERDCVDDGFRVCGQYDGDACLEWSAVSACPDNQGCSNGECSLECADECAVLDQTRCLFDGSGVQICTDSDGDGCLDWAGQTICGPGRHCEEGACVCDRVCELGQQRCLEGTAAFETCDLHGGDCPGWGGQTPCPQGWNCLAQTGSCTRPYPEGPYGTRYGDTVANECLERVECDGAIPTGTVTFCLQEILQKKAKLITIHSGW